jgi:hypothetical protein
MRTPLFAAALALAVALAPYAPTHAQTATLTVTGQGSASAPPDMAVVRAGVETDGATAAEALAANSALAARIIETLKAAGVAPGDIQTSGLAVQPVYRDPPRPLPQEAPEVAGYRVFNAVTVTIRDLGGMGAAIDAVVRAGANRIDSVSFGLSDDSALADAARRDAVADASRAASALAEAARVRLVRVLSIADGGGNGPRPVAGMLFRAEAAAVPVEAGESAIQASVTMVWEIAPGE